MTSYVLAAGGLVERQTPEGLRIAVVHRTLYEDRDGQPGDWVLPKGKMESGETLEEAALREVKEETGCTARLTGPSYRTEHSVGGMRKLVSFFRMEFIAEAGAFDSSEVAQVVWLAPVDALEQLTYRTERQVVRDAYPGLSTPISSSR